MTPEIDAWPLNHEGQPLAEDDCPVCGRDACEDPAHLPPTPETPGKGNGEARDGAQHKRCPHVLDANAVCTLCHAALGLDVDALHDASVAAARGREIAKTGIPYLVDGVVPRYGMLGFLVAYAKVGKTSLGLALGATVSSGVNFLGRATEKVRVLYIAAEDPGEYIDFLSRHLVTEPGSMTLFERNIGLDASGLARIAATVKAGNYGLVLVASWQAVIRGLIRDENDNAGAAIVVEATKLAVRETGIPWLIDAHSGRGEDQSDGADPVKALRGASAAAGAADYILSLRYADRSFGSMRRLSGRGRFVTLAPMAISFDSETGRYENLGSTKGAAIETTWQLIAETAALTSEPRSADAIARAAGLAGTSGKVGGQARRNVHDALRDRDLVVRTATRIKGKNVTTYSLAGGEEDA